MARLYLLLAAIFGGSGVLAGAFASHGLRGQISDRALAIFETATRYQLYHALALLGLALLLWVLPPMGAARQSLGLAGAGFVGGILLFCGSLYGLSLAELGLGDLSLGWITPLGGLAFLLGWGSLAIAALLLPNQPAPPGSDPISPEAEEIPATPGKPSLGA